MPPSLRPAIGVEVTPPSSPGRAVRPARSDARPGPPASWWLWPHLLSLDAPLVALAWQSWWARAAGVRLTATNDAILGLGVWMIYLADRLADTAPSAAGACATPRHTFYRRQRRLMRPLVVALCAGLTWTALRGLPARQLLPGLGLLSLTGLYFWLIHRRTPRGWSRVVPKEMVVGVMFALGTGFFVWVQAAALPVACALALPLFAAVCFANCALITKWERTPQDVNEGASLLNAFPRLVPRLGGVCVVLALLAASAAALCVHGAVFAPIIASALLLAGLDRSRRFFSLDAARVLADAVLLTPWLYLLAPFHRI